MPHCQVLQVDTDGDIRHEMACPCRVGQGSTESCGQGSVLGAGGPQCSPWGLGWHYWSTVCSSRTWGQTLHNVWPCTAFGGLSARAQAHTHVQDFSLNSVLGQLYNLHSCFLLQPHLESQVCLAPWDHHEIHICVLQWKSARPWLGGNWFPNKDMAWFKTLKYWSNSQSEWSCSLCPCWTQLEEKLKLNIDQRPNFG